MSASPTITKEKLRKKIEYLKSLQGRHSGFTTLYIPPSKNIVDVLNFLKQEYAGTDNIKSKTNRKNVADNLNAIISDLTKLGHIPENGIVFFYGIMGEQNNIEIREAIIPPEPLKNFIYICGSEFKTDELEQMLTPRHFIVTVLIEGGKYVVGYLRGKHIELVKEEDFYIMGKFRAGGQSSRRFERIREEKMLNFFRHLGKYLNELLLPQLDNIDAIVFGGNTIRVMEFLEKGELDYRLKEKVVDKIISVSTVDETGLLQIVKEISRIAKETEVYKERKLWERFIESLMKGHSNVTYGEKEVLDMLKQGRVDTILISEKKTDLIDEIIDIAEQFSTDVVIFSSQTESGAQLEAMGGVAAILRY